VRKARAPKTHCNHGHELTPDNLIIQSQRDGFLRRCRICRDGYRNSWNKTHKKYKQEYARQHAYGVSPEVYDALWKEQQGLCGLGCGRPIDATDHNHKTKRFRGLLCRQCNTGLGMLNEDPDLMVRAAEYVRRHNGDPQT
jgi:hypothetical protein